MAAACGTTSSSSACERTDTSGPCTGTFVCGNSGIQLTCDRATQVCVLKPGAVNCETVTGASATSCPSEAAAASLSGCTTPFHAACDGSSSSGITVSCEQ